MPCFMVLVTRVLWVTRMYSVQSWVFVWMVEGVDGAIAWRFAPNTDVHRGLMEDFPC